MNNKLRLAIAGGLLLLSPLVGTLPAQAETMVACARNADLTNEVRSGHFVPEDVLEMSNAHCWGGADDSKVNPEKIGPDFVAACKVVESKPSDRNEAKCIASWVQFWSVSDEPNVCVQHTLAKAKDARAAKTKELESACKWAELKETLVVPLGIGLTLVILIGLGVVFARNRSGPSDIPPPGYPGHHHHVVRDSMGNIR